MASILALVIFLTLLFCILFVLFFLKGFLNLRSSKKQQCCSYENLEQLMLSLDNMIESAVAAARQTGSPVFRNREEVVQHDRDEALEEIKHQVYSILPGSDASKLSCCLGGIDAWIHNRVEFYIKMYSKM